MDRVYVFKIKFKPDDHKSYYKIGKSSNGKHGSRSSIDRLLEVQRSHFMKHRYTFYSAIIRDRECASSYEVETKLHQLFKDKQYYIAPSKVFDGSTEVFDVEEHELLRAFDELLPLQKKAKQ